MDNRDRAFRERFLEARERNRERLHTGMGDPVTRAVVRVRGGRPVWARNIRFTRRAISFTVWDPESGQDLGERLEPDLDVDVVGILPGGRSGARAAQAILFILFALVCLSFGGWLALVI